jgi:hypothetical protein
MASEEKVRGDVCRGDVRQCMYSVASAVVGGLIVVLMIGGERGRVQAVESRDVISCREVRITDSDGKVLAEFGASNGDVGIRLMDKSGKVRLRVGVQLLEVGPPSGPYVLLLNEEERGGVSLGARGNRASIELWSGSSEYSAGVVVGDDSAYQFIGRTNPDSQEAKVRIAEISVDENSGVEISLTDRGDTSVSVGKMR